MKTRKQRKAEKAFQLWKATVLTCPLQEVKMLEYNAFAKYLGVKMRQPRPVSKKAIKMAVELDKKILPLMDMLLGAGRDPSIEMLRRDNILAMAYSVTPRKKFQRPTKEVNT